MEIITNNTGNVERIIDPDGKYLLNVGLPLQAPPSLNEIADLLEDLSGALREMATQQGTDEPVRVDRITTSGMSAGEDFDAAIIPYAFLVERAEGVASAAIWKALSHAQWELEERFMPWKHL